jgi:hypothetical protein
MLGNKEKNLKWREVAIYKNYFQDFFNQQNSKDTEERN